MLESSSRLRLSDCKSGPRSSFRAFFGLTLLAAIVGCADGSDMTPLDDPPSGTSDELATDVESLGQLEQALTCSLSQDDRVGNGFSMNSSVIFDNVTGEASVTTTLRNSRSVVGFTGGVLVGFVDANSSPLYTTELQRFGLDACRLRCPRTRTAAWQDTVPPNVLDRVVGISIVQAHAPTDRALPGPDTPGPIDSMRALIPSRVQRCL